MSGYLLIQAHPDEIESIHALLTPIEGLSVARVAGPYDLIARADTQAALGEAIERCDGPTGALRVLPCTSRPVPGPTKTVRPAAAAFA